MDKELKSTDEPDRKKTSVASFMRMKTEARRIVMVTSYDYPTAAIADAVGVDSVLVGDSYGMVVLGYENTIPVTVEELLTVFRTVRIGDIFIIIIADMSLYILQLSS